MAKLAKPKAVQSPWTLWVSGTVRVTVPRMEHLQAWVRAENVRYTFHLLTFEADAAATLTQAPLPA